MSSGLFTASAAIASSGAPTTMAPSPASAAPAAPAREPAPILSIQELSTRLRDLTESVSDIKHTIAVLLQRTDPLDARLLSSPPLDTKLLQPPLPLSVSGPVYMAAWAPPHIQSPPAPPQLYIGPSLFAGPDGAAFHGGSSMVTTPATTLARPLPPPSAATTAPVITFQHGMPYDGTATTSFPPAPPPSHDNPIQPIKFQPSPPPRPTWIATDHVATAVRLQAAARGLLARRHVREMRDLQLQFLQVALRGATDLDLVRCVAELGHVVSPTGGALQVYDINSQPAGRRHVNDVPGKPPTECLFLDNYGAGICLCLDEIVWKGLLKNTERYRARRLLPIEP